MFPVSFQPHTPAEKGLQAEATPCTIYPVLFGRASHTHPPASEPSRVLDRKETRGREGREFHTHPHLDWRASRSARHPDTAHERHAGGATRARAFIGARGRLTPPARGRARDSGSAAKLPPPPAPSPDLFIYLFSA